MKTYLITVFLLMASTPVLASNVHMALGTISSADALVVASGTTNNAQATPQHGQAGHDHTKHIHKKQTKKSEEAHDHSKHDHNDHVRKGLPIAKPTDKEYPIGVVRWPVFED